MKKVIGMISIMMIIVSSISNVFATNNIEVNSIIDDTVNEIMDDNEVNEIFDDIDSNEIFNDIVTNEIVNNTIDDVVDNKGMTKEELEQAIEKINKDISGKFILEDDKILLSVEDEQYTMSYNLEGNPKFISRAIITKDMTMDEYNNETQNLLLGIFGFGIVSVSKDIAIENATTYAVFSLFNYIELDEVQIYTEDTFDAMEVASKAYDEERIIEDELYKITMKKISSTETEYVVECTYEVKIDEDFSVIEEYNMDDLFPSNEILQNAQIAQNEFFEAMTNEEIMMNEMLELIEKQNNINKHNSIIENIIEIPQTGKTIQTEDILWIILISSVGVFILYCVYNKRKNGKE